MMCLVKHQRILPLVPFSSLADMAFILLVFFLLSSHFAEQQAAPVRLARAEAALDDASSRPLLFVLDATGGLALFGTGWRAGLDTLRPEDEASLRGELARHAPSAPGAPGACRLAIDATCPYHYVRRALRLIEQSGIDSLSFVLENRP